MIRTILSLSAIGLTLTTFALGAFSESKGEKYLPFKYQELEDLEGNRDQAAGQIPRLITTLESDDVNARLLAAVILGKVGDKAVDPVRARLGDKNAAMRYGCLLALALIGKEAARAADDVLPLLKDKDADVRNKAVYTLGKLGVQSDAVHAGLAKALEDSVVTETALEVLGKMDKLPKVTLDPLAKLATNGHESIRFSATRVLAKAGAASAPTFRELLKKTNINDRAKLFEAMLPLGKEAKVLTPELLDMVTDQVYPGGFIDGNLLKMVKDCGSDGAKGLAEILRSRNNDSIAFIARQSLLGTIGEMKGEAEAKASVPILIQLLKDNTPTHPVVEYRHLILEALGEIGPPAKQAIPTVESLTKPNFNGLTAEQQKAAQNVSEVAAVTLRRLGKAEKRGD